MERHILTWQREHAHDGLHPLFDDILRRQLMLPGHDGKNISPARAGEVPAAHHDLLRLGVPPEPTGPFSKT